MHILLETILNEDMSFLFVFYIIFFANGQHSNQWISIFLSGSGLQQCCKFAKPRSFFKNGEKEKKTAVVQLTNRQSVITSEVVVFGRTMRMVTYVTIKVQGQTFRWTVKLPVWTQAGPFLLWLTLHTLASFSSLKTHILDSRIHSQGTLDGMKWKKMDGLLCCAW